MAATDPLVLFDRHWKAEFRGFLLKGAPSPCHIWTARQNRDGYGMYRHRAAHRWLYMQLINPDLSYEETVHHRCHVRLCVNLDHLEIKTRGDNAREAVIYNGLQAKVYTCPKGHELRRKDAECLICNPRAYIKDPTLTYYEKRKLICEEQGITDKVLCAHGHEVKPEWDRRCIKCSNASAVTTYHNEESYYDKRKRMGGGVEPVLCVNGHEVPNDGAKSCLKCSRIKADKHRQKKGQNTNVYKNKPRD